MSRVNQRLAVLQQLVQHADLGPRLTEAWSRAEGLCALGAVLVPLSEASSASWHEFLSASDPAYLVKSLSEPRLDDRFWWGALARSAFTLGLTAGFLPDRGDEDGVSTLVRPVRHSRKPGAMESLLLRLNGLEGAPGTLTLVDLEAWMGALGEDAMVGVSVQVSEQAVELGRPLLRTIEDALACGELNADALDTYNTMLSAVRNA